MSISSSCRFAWAPLACLALAACEPPPGVIPSDAGLQSDARFPWEDASPGLDATSTGDGGGLDAGVDSGPAVDGGPGIDAGVPLPYTIVVLPDTQYYSSSYPDFFDAQTAWIVSERAAGNVAFVVHEGDIVDDDVEPQWMRAYHSLHVLDGVVPYVLSAGNHDYCCGGWPGDRTMTKINNYFPVSTFSGRPSFLETFEDDRIENNASLLDVPGGGGRWLVISVEFGPRNAVLAWAGDIAARYPDTPAILLTHAYLYDDDTRYDHVARPSQQWNPHSYPLGANGGDANDGEEMWQKLVLGHSNIRFVLSGHVLNSGVGRLSSTRPDGTVCHQILANYQNYDRGGDAYLRLMRFFPADRTVHVQTYSPAFDLSMKDDRNDFTLAY